MARIMQRKVFDWSGQARRVGGIEWHLARLCALRGACPGLSGRQTVGRRCPAPNRRPPTTTAPVTSSKYARASDLGDTTLTEWTALVGLAFNMVCNKVLIARMSHVLHMRLQMFLLIHRCLRYVKITCTGEQGRRRSAHKLTAPARVPRTSCLFFLVAALNANEVP
jgi:hypothetical protein